MNNHPRSLRLPAVLGSRFSALSRLDLYLGLSALVAGPYFALQRWPLRPPTVMRPTAPDLLVPFAEGLVWWYLSFFLVLPLALLAIRGHERLMGFAKGYASITLASHLVFLLLPTAVERPTAGLTDRAYRALLALDRPANACPSLHASLTLYGALWISGSLPAGSWFARVALWCWVAAILYATLATRQHVLLDLLAGAGLALIVFGIYSPQRHRAHEENVAN